MWVKMYLKTIVITFIMAEELDYFEYYSKWHSSLRWRDLREEKEPKKRVRRRWFCKIASFKWPHGWSFSTLLCSRVPGQMGRWPAILNSRRASFEKEWSKKGIFWRWPHHFWLLRNSCKRRKGKKMRYTNVRTRDQNVEKTYISVVAEIVQNLFPWHAHCAKNVIYGKEIILPWSLVTPGKKWSRNLCDTHRRMSEMACQS